MMHTLGGTELVQLVDDALRSAKGLGRNLVGAVGDTDEVKQSATPRRNQPAPGDLGLQPCWFFVRDVGCESYSWV